MASQSFHPKVVAILSFHPKVANGLPFHPKVVISLSFRGGQWCPQWWTLGLESPGWGPEGHSPHGGGDGMHICHPHGLICHDTSVMMWLAHIMATVGSITASSHKGSGSASWAATGNGSLCRQAITSWKLVGGVTCHAVSSGPVGNVGSDFVPSICRCSFALQHWALLSPELLQWGLCLDSQGIRGACLVAVTGQEGCNTSLHPGNWIGEFSLPVDSLLRVWETLSSSWGLPMGAVSSVAAPSTGVVSSAAASSTGELA